jgi:hypothetical protein
MHTSCSRVGGEARSVWFRDRRCWRSAEALLLLYYRHATMSAGMAKMKAKCRECGFLACLADTGPIEVPQMARTLFIADAVYPDPGRLRCTRELWRVRLEHKPITYAFQVLNSERDCRWFFPYQPGYSPAEHKELQQEEKSQRTMVKGMLRAAAIGAGATLVTAGITALVTWLAIH